MLCCWFCVSGFGFSFEDTSEEGVTPDITMGKEGSVWMGCDEPLNGLERASPLWGGS